MAGNKFATMLHKNCHRLIVILVYAVLEWILILLLLLNSFFLYLITKFANYFGLKTPCLWCSRVDHVLEPGKNTSSYRELLCETHAAEISKLGYCSNHRKLAETQTMCMDCLGSRPNHNYHSFAMAARISFFSWVKKDELENGCKILECSCCSQSLNNNLYSPYLLSKHSWKALKYTEKGNLIIEAVDDDDNDDNGSECKLVGKPDSFAEIERNGGEEHQMLSDVGSFGLKDSVEEECSGSESNLLSYEKEPNEDQKAHDLCFEDNESYGFLDCIHPSLTEDIGEDCILEFINLHFEKSSEHEVNRLIPVEEIDESTCANHASIVLEKEDLTKEYHQDETFDSSIKIETQVNASANEENAEVDSMEKINDDDEESFVLNLEVASKDFDGKACAHVNSLQAAKILSTGVENIEIADTKEPDDLQAQEEEINDLKLLTDQTQSELLIDLSNHAKQPQEQELTPPLPPLQEDFSSIINNSGAEISNSSETCMVDNEVDTNYGEKIVAEEKSVSADKNQETVNQISLIHSESNEAEEEKFPETPTSVDSFNYLHKKLLLFEKRESGTEDSLDGSVVSEMDCGDPVLTAEKLTTALKAERKALNALYAELEEERSASAIAANQTMAMINRLQEEKAAMQMEALQYQRMMDEQSEYDQEALQLLNELMIKREREKQELEKELEFYRNKVMDYEAKERMKMIRRSKDGSVRSRTSSATCSNAEDIDDLSIDLNREARDEDGSIFGNQDSSNNTSRDEVINLEEIALDCVKQISALDDSLAEFEEERLSILDQLKALEEKLLTLHDNELEEDAKSVDHSSKYSVKGSDESYELSTPEENDISHALLKDKHHTERKTVGSMAKSLLPLLDAADNETEEGLIFDENVASEFVEIEHISVPKIELDSKKVSLKDEVDHVYERLQALEADREFLKHCMSSIKKGDKGMDLLQEILQHLRDLRAVELRVRNMSDDHCAEITPNHQETADERFLFHG